jgi:hypothetical protein
MLLWRWQLQSEFESAPAAAGRALVIVIVIWIVLSRAAETDGGVQLLLLLLLLLLLYLCCHSDGGDVCTSDLPSLGINCHLPSRRHTNHTWREEQRGTWQRLEGVRGADSSRRARWRCGRARSKCEASPDHNKSEMALQQRDTQASFSWLQLVLSPHRWSGELADLTEANLRMTQLDQLAHLSLSTPDTLRLHNVD